MTDPPQVWGMAPGGMALLGHSEAPMNAPPQPATSVAEPISQVAKLLLHVGGSAGAVAAQSLAAAVGRAVRGILAEAPPPLRVLGPGRERAAPPQETRAEATLDPCRGHPH